MKKKSVIYLGLIIMMAIVSVYLVFAEASDFQPIEVSGFNQDLIAENSDGTSAANSTTTSFDGQNSGANNVMYSVEFRGPNNTNSAPPFGLPSNRIIESSQNAGVSYQLEPYNSNNALLLIAQNDQGTLSLNSSGAYEKIVLLASSAEGQSTFDVILNFSDGTSMTTSFTVKDWYFGTGYATQGIGRVTRNADIYAISNLPIDADGVFSGDASNPRLYDCFIDNSAQRTKLLTGLTVKKTSSAGRTAILAVTGQKNANAPSTPVAKEGSAITSTTFIANWESVLGATSYKLDIATDLSFTNMVDGYNNLEVGDVLAYSCTGLSHSTTYYYRVRAVNADGGSFSSNTITLTMGAASNDSSLKATSKVKGVNIVDFGTPANTTEALLPGTVMLSAIQGSNTTNAGSYITIFETNHNLASIHKIVKYTLGSSVANFTTDDAYDGLTALNDGDFLVIKVVAEDGSSSFYKIIVSYEQVQTTEETTEETTENQTTEMIQTTETIETTETIQTTELIQNSEETSAVEEGTDLPADIKVESTEPLPADSLNGENEEAISELENGDPQEGTNFVASESTEVAVESEISMEVTNTDGEATITSEATSSSEIESADGVNNESQAITIVTKAEDVLNTIFSERIPVGPVMLLNLQVSVGAKVEGKEVTVSAKGLKPFTEVALTLYSTPQLIGSDFADANGEVNIQTIFPENVPIGTHTIIASGIGPEGEPVQAVSAFELDESENVIAYVAPSQVLKPIEPSDKRLMRALEANKPLYDAQRYPGTVVSIIIVFAGLGGISSLGGMTKPSNHRTQKSQSSQASQSSSSEDSELIEALAIEIDEDDNALTEKHLKWGDRSFLWKTPGTSISDRWSVGVADSLAGISLLLKRLVSDGSWARAMFGSGGFSLWIIGAILGIYSTIQVGNMALPPAYSLVVLIVILGILDGAAGAIAWIIITITALVTGHVTTFDDLRTLAGLSALFTSMVYLIGMRPIKREIDRSSKYYFDRTLDYLMPALIVSIASSTLLEAINGLSGLELFTADNASHIKFVAIGALWIRLAMEDLTTRFFPKRCEKVRPKSTIEQKMIFQWGAIFAYEVMFVLISGPFFGLSIALFLIMAMETIPWMLSFIQDRFPNSKLFYKWYPGPTSIYMLALLTVFNIILSAWLINESSDYQQICSAFVLMLIPYTLAEIPGLFGREGENLPDSWTNRAVETMVWIFFALVALEIVQLI